MRFCYSIGEVVSRGNRVAFQRAITTSTHKRTESQHARYTGNSSATAPLCVILKHNLQLLPPIGPVVPVEFLA